MDTKAAYNSWSEQYDTNLNRTRDLEALALRQTLAGVTFNNCLEIGCGTGKNTVWLTEKAGEVTAVDLSDDMLAKAKEKISSQKVHFIQADILHDWHFVTKKFDLVIFSLVLEHIENLEPVMEKVSRALVPGGYVYIGELHPFKQYTGSKARFTTDAGEQVVTCYDHHISDFIEAAKKFGIGIIELKEFFDNGDRTGIPRILMLLLQKQTT